MFDELLESDEAEEEFLQRAIGGQPPPPPPKQQDRPPPVSTSNGAAAPASTTPATIPNGGRASNGARSPASTTSTTPNGATAHADDVEREELSPDALWNELERLRGLRVELSNVVDRRLDRCRETGVRALASSSRSAELRAAITSLGTVLDSAAEAAVKRAEVDQAFDAAMSTLGRPRSVVEGGWVGDTQLEVALAKARDQGRSEALETLQDCERLRTKCDLFKRRVAELESELDAERTMTSSTLSDVSLGSSEEAGLLEERCEAAEAKLAALVGTERHARLSSLELQLDEQRGLVSALRDALNDSSTIQPLLPPPPINVATTPTVELRSSLATPPTRRAPSSESSTPRNLMSSSYVSDSEAFLTDDEVEPSEEQERRPTRRQEEEQDDDDDDHRRVIQLAEDTFVV